MEKRQSRPPIVTVLGHVDHGKTTLLDAIRKTSVAAREAGGITQSIGASIAVTKEGKKITFIDTPGHAAFGKMRSRGAKVADIAILVIAAEEGVKPQTLEALQLIKEAEIPFIVAITKIDLPSADIDGAKDQLAKQGVGFEGLGGDTPVVGVSGKTGNGVGELLETISLLSEVTQIEGDAQTELEAVVIETQKDRRGPLASAVVRNGTLKTGEMILADGVSTKVRGLFDYLGKAVKEAYPGDPVQILGFETLPPVGAKISSQTGDLVSQVSEKPPLPKFKLRKGEIAAIVKAGSTGSLEAVLGNLPPSIVVIDSGVGDIFESDVLLAKASGVGRIFAFEAGASVAVKNLARAEGVAIEEFKIIYELFQRLEELVKKGEVEILGKAEIIASFPFNNRKVAGARVLTGKIGKTDILSLLRGEKELGKIKAVSLKKQKQEISEAKAGEEFGIIFEPQLAFAIGDMIVSVRK
jgi:translation initiation factor IF-2